MSRTLPPTFWRRVWELVRPWRGLLALTAACVIAASLAELVPPFVVKEVIDRDLLAHRPEGLGGAAAIYVAAVLADAAFSFGYGYLSAVVAQKAIAAVRVRIFEHLARVPVSYFDRTPLGDMISRATSDVETVDDLFTSGLATMIGQLVPVVAVVAAMIAVSPVLTAVSVLVAPPLLLASRWLQVRVRDAERATRVAVGRLNSQLSETLGGVETVRAFGREDAFADRFRDTLRQTLRAQQRSVAFNAYFAPLTNLLYAAAVAVLLWAAASGVLSSAGITLGTLTAFILLFQRFFAPIVAIGDQWQSVQAALAGAERVFETLDLEPEAVAPPSDIGMGPPEIRVEGVTHGYEPDHPVLHQVTLRVGAGEQVALVGRTGAGKSTLVSLLGGLSEPWSGKVLVAGRDPRLLPDEQRRQTIGVVPQTVHLFTATVHDNLTLGDPSITETKLSAAMTIAGLTPLVSTLPQGTSTVLAGSAGGNGLRLSAGERQLITLARALASDPAVIVLDEATASVDAATEATIRGALSRTAGQAGDRAVLTIAHRLATAREADRVIVLDGGRIVEEGSPAELATADGHFAALLELEEAGWDLSGSDV